MISQFSIRKDWALIEKHIKNNSSILDIGCGEGDLINELEKNKKANTRGLEIDGELVRNAISKGLKVVQGNAEKDLIQYLKYFYISSQDEIVHLDDF